ncbi:hypothetical protein RZS08_03115, partial [Arthrospira platensis SPKY1]|nr:hypothetical protein [Arthrospira platensis SPKY1]
MQDFLPFMEGTARLHTEGTLDTLPQYKVMPGISCLYNADVVFRNLLKSTHYLVSKPTLYQPSIFTNEIAYFRPVAGTT